MAASKMNLKEIVLIGRMFDEYSRMFDLKDGAFGGHRFQLRDHGFEFLIGAKEMLVIKTEKEALSEK